MDDTKLDPRLRFLMDQAADERLEAAESIGMCSYCEAPQNGGLESAAAPASIAILLRCRKAPGTKLARSVERKLKALGVTIHAIVDGPAFVVTGSIAIDQLDALLDDPWIEVIEASTPLFADLDISGRDVQVRQAQQVNPTLRGTNVLVGIIDTGIDFAHDDFRHPDGTSRILFLWDQSAAMVPGGTAPFGRVYAKADLDAALRTNPAPAPIPFVDDYTHGTHVSGIAAGNGRKSNGKFMGMAPDSGLVVVALRGDGGTLGESSSAAAAFNFIADRARELERPVSINMSQGTNAGGHSGETQLEGAMDNLARRPGVVVVKSAGNEQSWRIHASGQLAQGSTIRRVCEAPGAPSEPLTIEVWFDARDRIDIAAQAPGGPAPEGPEFVSPGAFNTIGTFAGNRVRIDARNLDAGGTGDARVLIMITRGSAPTIQPGHWTLHFRANEVTDGRFDAWIERAPGSRSGQVRFTTADEDPTATISIPGTARRIITVGSYVTRFDNDAAVGELSRFSSRGPTRYGIRKPEIAAPGEAIVSVMNSQVFAVPFEDGYLLDRGTSMAAPHVAGVSALLLEINPRFTCEQVKQILARAARRDGAAALAPDHAWGFGRLTAQGAIDLARTAQFPVVSSVAVNGNKLSWSTDIPTTGAARFNRNQRRMLLGRAEGSRADLSVGTQHEIDLSGLPPGAYYCEILAFASSPGQWQTIEDNDGQHHVVSVAAPVA